MMRTKKRASRRHISRGAALILYIGLAAVSAALIYTAFGYSSLDTYDAARSYPQLAEMMEHILMSLLLTVGGALICDVA